MSPRMGISMNRTPAESGIFTYLGPPRSSHEICRHEFSNTISLFWLAGQKLCLSQVDALNSTSLEHPPNPPFTRTSESGLGSGVNDDHRTQITLFRKKLGRVSATYIDAVKGEDYFIHLRFTTRFLSRGLTPAQKVRNVAYQQRL